MNQVAVFWHKYDDPNIQQWLSSEFLSGRLRQGWGPPGSSLLENGSPVPLDVLRLLMEEHELTQAAVAEMLGTSQSLVSMILSGARPITVEHANRLGERFRVDASLFLDLKRSREI